MVPQIRNCIIHRNIIYFKFEHSKYSIENPRVLLTLFRTTKYLSFFKEVFAVCSTNLTQNCIVYPLRTRSDKLYIVFDLLSLLCKYTQF